MKTFRIARMAAISAISVVLLSGCGSDNDTENKAPIAAKAPTATQSTATESTTPGLETPVIAAISKSDVEKIIFADGFDSPQYYQTLLSAAEGAQQQEIFQELSKTKDVKVCDKLSSESSVTNCTTNFKKIDIFQYLTFFSNQNN